MNCEFCGAKGAAWTRCDGCATNYKVCGECHERCDACSACSKLKCPRCHAKCGGTHALAKCNACEGGAPPSSAGKRRRGAADPGPKRGRLAVSTSAPGKKLRADAVAICGSLGLEIEFAGLKLFYVEGKKRVFFACSKAVLRRADCGVSIEMDGDHIEFVTDPVSTCCAADPSEALARLNAQLEFISGFYEEVCGLSVRKTIDFEIDLGLQGYKDCAAELGKLQKRGITHIHLAGLGGNARPNGTMQGTIGTTLGRYPLVLAQEISVGDILANINKSWMAFIGHEFPSPDVTGLIYATAYYILRLREITERHREKDGLKTALNVLARTDFATMFTALSPSDQAVFVKLAMGFFSAYLKNRVVPGGYDAPDTPETGPTVEEWLTSFHRPTNQGVVGGRVVKRIKDLLSPPEGWHPHSPGVFTYSMGKYGRFPVAGCKQPSPHQLILFEFRNVAAQCSIESFQDIAVDFASFALGINESMAFKIKGGPASFVLPPLGRWRRDVVPSNGDCMYEGVSRGYHNMARGNHSVAYLRGIVADELAKARYREPIRAVLSELRGSMLDNVDGMKPVDALNASDLSGALKASILASLAEPDEAYAWAQGDIDAYIQAVRNTALHAGELEGSVLGALLAVRIEYTQDGGGGVLAEGPEDDGEEKAGDNRPRFIRLAYNGADHYDVWLWDAEG